MFNHLPSAGQKLPRFSISEYLHEAEKKDKCFSPKWCERLSVCNHIKLFMFAQVLFDINVKLFS